MHALLVCGARELAYHPGAHVYVCWRVGRLLDECPHPTVLLQGGALGPDRWAGTVARNRGVRVVTYLPDGVRLDTHALARRWAEGDPGPLARNRAMVDGLTTARGLGWGALVVGYVTPWEPATRGTDATLRRAAECGLCVERVTVPALVG
jgi:hypothetical protein